MILSSQVTPGNENRCILEGREHDKPTYRTICISCGVLGDVGDSALQMAQDAIESGWVWLGGDFHCTDCASAMSIRRPAFGSLPPNWKRPENIKKPEHRCQHCGKATKSVKKPGKKCPKCKGVLWPKLT